MAQIVDYPPGTEFSDFRGPKPCFTCKKNVFLRFTKLPDGSKGKTLSYEEDKMTLHPCGPQLRLATAPSAPLVREQQQQQPEQPQPQQQQAFKDPMTWVKKSKDEEIMEMHKDKEKWHDEDGARHQVFMLKLDMLIAMGSGLTSAINRYVEFKKEEAERERRPYP